jgi:hypothetical protein
MVTVSGVVAPDTGPAPRRTRRWLRRLVAVLVVAVLLIVAAAAGVAWYFSGVALAVDHSSAFPVTVLAPRGAPSAVGQAAVGQAGAGQAGAGQAGAGQAGGVVAPTVRLSRDPDTVAPGTVGLAWASGYGRIGAVVASDSGSVTRTFIPVSGGLPAVGTPARVDSYTYAGDPSSAIGLAFSQVRVAGPLGPLPTWFVPAPGHRWIVFVHGHDADRQESLRYLRTWHDLGYPVLVPSYRDDVGAPSSPDRWHHLGDTEWQDVAAAIRWAHDHGAADVVLAGWSMGGAIALQTVARSDVAGLVRGLLLDSPVIDWRDVFAAQGADRGLPGVEVTLAQWVVQWRSGISLDRLDWVARANQLRVPTLILHSDSDDYVPDGPAVRLAAARPDLVTLVRVPGARHTLDRNVDPTRYDDAVRSWLARLPT